MSSYSKNLRQAAAILMFCCMPTVAAAAEAKFDLHCSTEQSQKDSYYSQSTQVTTFTSIVKIDLDRGMFCYYNPDISSSCAQSYSFGWDLGSKIDDYEYTITDQAGNKFAIWKSSLDFRVVTGGKTLNGRCTRSAFTGLPS